MNNTFKNLVNVMEFTKNKFSGIIYHYNVETENSSITINDVVITFTEDNYFLLEKIVVVPGVYRTANGDGWPDDVDFHEIGQYSSIKEVVTNAMKKICHSAIIDIFDNMPTEEVVTEEY